MTNNKRFMWPVLSFWKFTPWALLVAIAWNLFELVRLPMPLAPQAFGIICGHTGRRVVK